MHIFYQHFTKMINHSKPAKYLNGVKKTTTVLYYWAVFGIEKAAYPSKGFECV